MSKKFLLPIVLGGLSLTACSGPAVFKPGISSHAVLPNSNVVPLGPVSAKADGESKFLSFPDMVTSANDRKIYNAAIQKVPGATNIIDYTVMYKTKFVPIPLLGGPLVSWTELELEGTAVKAQTGLQELR